jgi:hypothetical protein
MRYDDARRIVVALVNRRVTLEERARVPQGELSDVVAKIAEASAVLHEAERAAGIHRHRGFLFAPQDLLAEVLPGPGKPFRRTFWFDRHPEDRDFFTVGCSRPGRVETGRLTTCIPWRRESLDTAARCVRVHLSEGATVFVEPRVLDVISGLVQGRAAWAEFWDADRGRKGAADLYEVLRVAGVATGPTVPTGQSG